MEPPQDVWRTEDRLHTDEAVIARLCEWASRDAAIREVIDVGSEGEAGNGSVFISGTARHDRTPALLKLGARKSERYWMTAVDEAAADVVPRVFGSGELRGVGWLVLEQCSSTFARNSPSDVAAVVSSMARYQHAATTGTATEPTMDPAWLAEHLRGAQAEECPADLERALGGLEETWAFVKAQCGLDMVHGDVHFANVVARAPGGAALLIDPMPIKAVWAWDAAYLQATLAPYVAPLSAHGHGLVRNLAGERQALGLRTAEDLQRVEEVVLGWAAALWWRIAPWRHNNERWRTWVEQHLEAICR